MSVIVVIGGFTYLLLYGLGKLLSSNTLPVETYGGDLENYILGKLPKHVGDIERLTREYENLKFRGYL